MSNNNINDDLSLRDIFLRISVFWKPILYCVLFSLFIAFLINRYSPKVFTTTAKIAILDKKETALELPSAEDLFSNSSINIENEIEVLTSYPILLNVVKNLNLPLQVYSVFDVSKSLIIEYPFDIETKVPLDEFSDLEFEIEVLDDGFKVIDYQNDKELFFKNYTTKNSKHDLPFEISNFKLNQIASSKGFYLKFLYVHDLIYDLKQDIKISQVGKESDIISLEYSSTNATISENILNELINQFDSDGIIDRQLIHKRTIDFINERFINLSFELDSIENYKKLYKSNNDILDFTVNSTISLESIIESEKNIFSISNQIYITEYLIDNISIYDSSYELLPANLGIENVEINNLVSKYNEYILELNKLIYSAGKNNPYILQLKKAINDIRSNILFSLKSHLVQLNKLNDNFDSQFKKYNNQIINLPEKEKSLRSIERNQTIKEALYLFLLQKREEARVSYAVTEPSIKVVEYAISEDEPVSPRTLVVYIIAFFLGVIIPLFVIYINFLFDTKVSNREEIESSGLNVLGEIPFLDSNQDNLIFRNPDDRSIISESFRMLMTNTQYLRVSETKSNVILITSSIKGEGKTLNAINLALSFASLEKKVLLIGCDLRNPQLHKYFAVKKNIPGLVDFLVDKNKDWKNNIFKPFNENKFLNVLLSGPIPPNPFNLITNGNLELLLEQARQEYDYIVIDSAPTLLVADTKSVIDLVDSVLFVVRANFTDKHILNHINDLSNSSSNIAVVLNSVGEKNSYGYSYNYRYNYKYSYNYGYGYGYSFDDEKS